MTKVNPATDSSTIERSRRKLEAQFSEQEQRAAQIVQKLAIDPAVIASALKKSTAQPGVEPKLIESERVQVLEESRHFDQMIAAHPEVSAALSSRNITVQN